MKTFKQLQNLLKESEYRGMHAAPQNDGYHKPMHDAEEIMPDVYSSKGLRLYGGYKTYDREGWEIIKSVQGQPNKIVEVFRAVPKDVKNAKITKGDWVTQTRGYAKDHGEGSLKGNYKIIKKRVKAGHLWTEGLLHEWGYDPS